MFEVVKNKIDMITRLIRNFVKGYNKPIAENASQDLNKNLEIQKFCHSCGARIKQNSPYCPACKTIVPLSRDELRRREDAEKAVRLQFEEAKENIIKLRDSENLLIVDNYVKKYSTHLKGTVKFENLKELLKTKNFDFNRDELEIIIRLRHSNLLYKDVKAKILSNNPVNADECLRNYLALFNSDINEPMIRQILQDVFNYDGNIESDIAKIRSEIVREKSANEIRTFESDLMAESSANNQITIHDIDIISGYDFELLLEKLFEGMGYSVTHTTLSNDQGADLILEKDNTRTVVQAKNWTANVGNAAIQEAVAAIKHYNSHRALVVSSSGFTQSAIDLAHSNNVELWDRAK